MPLPGPRRSELRPARNLQAATLSGNRLHLNDGPIDLILWVDGDTEAVAKAFRHARRRFDGLLDELVAELPVLRSPMSRDHPGVNGPTARRMFAAAERHRDVFVTPMAAVAGAVADEMLHAMIATGDFPRAYVNNGGDIALHLRPDRTLEVGIVSCLRAATPDGRVRISAADDIRGIATSGLHGRSLSLGIADAVTVLAATGAEADVAATLIANAVDIDHPRIRRVPARDLDPDSDLGDRLVTMDRGTLPADAVQTALQAGAARAQAMLDQALIRGALLSCAGQFRVVGVSGGSGYIAGSAM